MPHKKYKPEFAGMLLEMMHEGASVVEVARTLKVSDRMLRYWKDDKDKPEFKEAWELGHLWSEAWWEATGRAGVTGQIKSFNALVYIYTMKCRFGGKWLQDGKTNQLLITTKHQNITDDQLNERIKQMLDLKQIEEGNQTHLIELNKDEFKEIEPICISSTSSEV